MYENTLRTYFDAVETFWQKVAYDAAAAYIDASLAWLARVYKTPLATPDR